MQCAVTTSLGSKSKKTEKVTEQFLRKKIPKSKNGLNRPKMAAKSPKSKIRKKRPRVLGYVTFSSNFGKIRTRTSEIRSVTDDDGRRRRRTQTHGNRLLDLWSINLKSDNELSETLWLSWYMFGLQNIRYRVQFPLKAK